MAEYHKVPACVLGRCANSRQDIARTAQPHPGAITRNDPEQRARFTWASARGTRRRPPSTATRRPTTIQTKRGGSSTPPRNLGGPRF